MREYCKELVGASEKLGAEAGDYPEDTFSGDPGKFSKSKEPIKGKSYRCSVITCDCHHACLGPTASREIAAQ